MEFEVTQVRQRGKMQPRHALWAGRVRGELYVVEAWDKELNRNVRQATISKGGFSKVLLGPLLDAVLVSAKPDWWTMTGWERIEDGTGGQLAFQNSWILIPVEAV